MADRRVKVTFSAEIQGFKRAMEEAAQATQKVKQSADESSKAADTYLGRMVQSATKNRDEWEKTGTVMLGFGTAVVGGLSLAGKAASDWESAWAGVNKTVDGSPEQMAALEKELRGLAKTLPATHEEIAGVAEAAGQLGIKRESVAAFTKTMIDLGESTNLSADEAATGLARFSNVMGTSQKDVGRLGSTLVGLGNNFATTESEILAMSMRLAGAGKQAGLTEGDVMGIATAMSSVGIEAEAGGSAMSLTMKRIEKATREGGSSLDLFASTSGMTSEEFQKAWKDDAAGALTTFIAGLGDTAEAGGSTNAVLTELGITGIREADSLLRLSSASGVLTDALGVGNDAFRTNTALAEEAAKRYETTESKVKIAWNNIKDAAIDAGAVLLPIIQGVAESVAGMAQAFGNLPDPVKGALTILGGVVGVAALGAGAFLTLTPKILDSMQAFDKLAPAGSKARGVIGKAGVAAGVAAAAYTALATAATLAATATDNDRTKTSVEDFNNALTGIATNGDKARDSLDAAFNGVTKPGNSSFTAVNDLESAMKRVFNPQVNDNMNDFFSTLSGNNATSGINSAKDAIGNLDKAIASMASSGNIEDAAAGFRAAAEAAEKQGKPIGELVELFPVYKDAVLSSMTANGETQVSQEALTDAMLKGTEATDGAATATEKAGAAAEVAAAQSEEIEKALEDVGLAADGTVTDLVKFTDALFNAGLLQLSARDAARGFEAAIDAMAESLAANGRTLDRTTEAGRANEAALDGIAGAGYRSAEAMAANGASQEDLAGNLDTTFNKLVAAARQFTDTDEEAQALARDIMRIPPGVDIKTWMDGEAKRIAAETKKAIEDIPPRKDVAVVITYSDVGRDEAMARRVQATDGKATGGRVPGFTDGGRLPSTGPGTNMTDGFLGIDSAGMPRVRVDASEWIINPDSSNRYNRELAAINAGTFPKMPGYANGGRAREYSAQQLGYAPYRSTATAAASVTNNFHITTPADPVVTSHEVSRRQQSLNP